MSKARGSINTWLLMGILVMVIVIIGVIYKKQTHPTVVTPEPKQAERFKIPPHAPQTAQIQPPAQSSTAGVSATAPTQAAAPEPTAETKLPAVPPSGEAPSGAPAATTPVPVLDAGARFPYSISLGSYRNRENANKVIMRNTTAGLMPYSVEVDLGNKGTWYRVFVGYFPSQEAADRFIAESGIKQAKAEKTRYANQIGIFPSQEKLKSSSEALIQQGHYPYTLKRARNQIALLIGAFYTSPEAQKHCQMLKSAGMRCEVVER